MTAIVDGLTHADVTKLIRLVEALHKSELRFLRLEGEGLSIGISKDAPTAVDHAQPASGLPVLAGNVGVFRTAPLENGQHALVGAEVNAESEIGFIHTLDDINAVKAGVAGSIAEAYIRDGDFVEFGQPLFKIVPAAA